MTNLAGLIDLSGVTIGRGKQPSQLRWEVVRDVELEDMLTLATSRSSSPQLLKQIRQSHHTLARLLAQGMKHVEIASITGYSTSRISILQDDPAFEELVVYYRSMEEAGFKSARADMHSRLAELGFDSIEALHERVAEKGDTMPLEQLITIVKLTADRTGHGPTSTQNVKHSHSLDEETLHRIRGEGSGSAPVRPLLEEDRGALLRLANAQTDVGGSAAEILEGEFEPAEGASLRNQSDPGAQTEEAGGGDLPSVASVPGPPRDWLL